MNKKYFLKLSKLLNEPVFSFDNVKSNILISVLVGIFISLFLLLFYDKPEYSPHSWIHFGIITTITILFVFYFYPKIFPKFFKRDELTIKLNLIFSFILMTNIAVFNSLYLYLYLGLESQIIPVFIITYVIGIIPTVIIHLILRIKYLYINLQESQKVNNILEHKKEKSNNNTNEITLSNLKIDLSKLYFAKSEGNYINIFFDENGELKNLIIRYTLKGFLEIVSHKDFLDQCHRSYIVNLNKIIKISGNSRGYNLILNDINQKIPMTNSFSETILSKIKNDEFE